MYNKWPDIRRLLDVLKTSKGLVFTRVFNYYYVFLGYSSLKSMSFSMSLGACYV